MAEETYSDLFGNNNDIDIDINKNVQQKCLRFLDNLKNDNIMMDNLVNNNELFIESFLTAIKTECNKKYIKK